MSERKQIALQKVLATAKACQDWRAEHPDLGINGLFEDRRECSRLDEANRAARIEFGRVSTEDEAKICKVVKFTDLSTNEEFVDMRVPLDVFKRIREAVEMGMSDEEHFALAADGRLFARTLSVLLEFRKIDC